MQVVEWMIGVRGVQSVVGCVEFHVLFEWEYFGFCVYVVYVCVCCVTSGCAKDGVLYCLQ